VLNYHLHSLVYTSIIKLMEMEVVGSKPESGGWPRRNRPGPRGGKLLPYKEEGAGGGYRVVCSQPIFS
jgi:hypothetical protein